MDYIALSIEYEKQGKKREQLNALLDSIACGRVTGLLLDEIGRWFVDRGQYSRAALWFALSRSLSKTVI